MVWGAAALLIALAMMTWMYPPPGLAAVKEAL
jgi:hypothetical protein